MPGTRPAAKRANLAQKAYHDIQARIFSGEYAPGSVISEAALAKSLGISRTPVGEAMRQLVRDGLVQQVPRFGTIVRGVDPRSIQETYELREAIESYAVGKAAMRVTDGDLERLDRCLQVMEMCGSGDKPAAPLEPAMLRRFLAADMAFHLVILELAGNSKMIEAVQNARGLSSLLRLRHNRHDTGMVSGAVADHRAILDALRRRDPADAEKHMRDHISRGKDRISEYLRQHSRESASAPTLPLELQRELESLEQSMHIRNGPLDLTKD